MFNNNIIRLAIINTTGKTEFVISPFSSIKCVNSFTRQRLCVIEEMIFFFFFNYSGRDFIISYDKINSLKTKTMFRRQCDGNYVYGSYQPFQFYASIVTLQQCSLSLVRSCVFVVVVLTLGIVRWVNVVEVQNNVFNMNPAVKTFVWFTIDPPIKTLKYISGRQLKKKREHMVK